MAHWIHIEKHRYQCSECGRVLETGYPIADWNPCPWCGSDMEEEDELHEGTD